MVMVVPMRVMKHETSVYRSRRLESRSNLSPAVRGMRSSALLSVTLIPKQNWVKM